MGFDFLSQAAKFLQERKEYRRWLTAFLCLALVVAFGTVTALKMYGHAMTHQEKVLDCRYEVHEHTEDCYEEDENGEKILICGLADYVIHVHNDDCYDQDGELVCPLEEHEPHAHDDSCWEEEEVLICGEEETEGSTEDAAVEETAETVKTADDDLDAEESGAHAESGRELSCEKEEHTHGDSCYAEGTGCGKEAHVHDSSCYETTETLICEETEHTHDDGCYGEGESALVCDQGEHEHGDGCYDDEGSLTCEEEEHTHDDGCYSAGDPVLICEEPEHSHSDSCYEVTETLTCETEEHEHDDSCEAESELICKEEEHEHDDSCYTETEPENTDDVESAEAAETEEAVKPEESTESGHTHTDDCYRTEEVMACGEQELHIHDDSCYDESCFDEDGSLIEGSRVSCGLLQLEEHVHTKECFRTDELTDEEVSERNRRQLETTLEYKEGLIQVIVTDDGLAGIPEDAELKADLITEETDAELYQERMHAAQELTGFSEENTGLLFHIRLLADEEEIELQDTVNMEFRISADGFKEKSAVRTVCFGGDAPKELESTELVAEEDGSLSIGFDSASSGQLALLIEDDGLPEGVYKKEFTQEYEDWTLKVIATYGEDAQIPEDAALIVEPITKESDRTLYQEKMGDARKVSGQHGASAELLYSIGFYEDQLEIEPKGVVNIEFQMVRDGIEAGTPVTVVHFGEEETKVLESTDMIQNEDGSFSTSFDSDSFSPFAVLIGGNGEIRQTGVIKGKQIVYAEADRTSDSYDLNTYEPELESPVRIEILETVSDAAGEAWYRYAALTEDEALKSLLAARPFVPAADVVLEEGFVQRTLTATDEDGVKITVEGLLPEDAELTVEKICDPDISDVEDMIEAYLPDSAKGDFRLVYNLDIGKTRTLLEPVTVTVSNFDFDYYEYSNLASWVYHIHPEEEELSQESENIPNDEEKNDIDPGEGGVEKIEAAVKEEGAVEFQTDGFSTFFLALELMEGREEYFNGLAEQGGKEEVTWDFEEESDEEETEDSAMDAPRMRAASRAAAPPSGQQITSPGGSSTKDGITISKTIAGTELENVFDITLQVNTTENIKELYGDPDMAVVIVMDISNTMTQKFGTTTRYAAAMDAASSFIDQFKDQCQTNSRSKIGFVTFNTNSKQIFAMSQCCTNAQATNLKKTMKSETKKVLDFYDSTKDANGNVTTHERFTNVEAGLKRAQDMLKPLTNKNKYIVFLSDGFPTTYIKSGYTGYDPYTGSGTKGNDGVFYDYVRKKYCIYGTDYSDKAAIRARERAVSIKSAGIKIFSIGVAVGDQTIQAYVDKHAGREFSTVDRTGKSYEIGSASKKTAYENWLKGSKTAGIGSGYYYSSTNKKGLETAFNNIFKEIKTFHEQSSQSVWIAKDPLPTTGGTAKNDKVEFIGFYLKDKTTLSSSPATLNGSYTKGGENTANCVSNTISWDLKNSGYASSTSGGKTTYTYTLKYRVRLKNEASGFTELTSGNPTSYPTNNKTTLSYQTITTKNGTTTISDPKSMDFPIPAVKGYLSELTFSKIDRGDHPVKGAEFTLTHDTAVCRICRGNKTAVSIQAVKKTSDANGKVTFTNIPSGHQYLLTESKVPEGYEASGEKYRVAVAYDRQTVTVLKADGTVDTARKWDGKVVNTARYNLPETGGPGARPIVVSGILLTGAALLYGYRIRRRRYGRRV